MSNTEDELARSNAGGAKVNDLGLLSSASLLLTSLLGGGLLLILGLGLGFGLLSLVSLAGVNAHPQ